MMKAYQFNSARSLLAAAFASALAFGPVPAALAYGAGSGSGGGAPAGQTQAPGAEDMTTCPKGKVWDVKNHKCLAKKGDVPPVDHGAEYSHALAEADRVD